MSLFSKILGKLGLGHDDNATRHAPTATESDAVAASAPPSSPSSQTVSGSAATSAERPIAPSQAAPLAAAMVSQVDVAAKLDGLAASHTEKLDWKHSIVDLMKLLGLDSSLAERKALATELGCPTEKMNDSAQMNMWLHKSVLARIAANGGNVPSELLH